MGSTSKYPCILCYAKSTIPKLGGNSFEWQKTEFNLRTLEVVFCVIMLYLFEF